MGLLKATAKFIARSVNDAIFNSKDKKIKKKAYDVTGKKIKKAKKNKIKVDGSAAYHNSYYGMSKKNRQKKNKIDKLIDEI